MSLTVSLQKIRKSSLAIAGGLTGEFLLFSASTLIFQFSRLIVSLVVAYWVGPDEFGIWNALNLLLLYGVFFTLGIPNGMNRNVPYLRGKGEQDKSQNVIDLSFGFVTLINVIVSLIIMGISFTPLVDVTFQPALFWMGLLFFAWQMYQFFQMYLKSNINFKLMSTQQIIFAALFPMIILPLAYIWGVPGFVGGQAIVALCLVCTIIYISKFRISFFWNSQIFKLSVKIGFPIMAAGLLYSLLTTVDRWVILHFLGVEALGNYTLAILCLSILSLLPAVIAQQMYPRMAFHYGKTQSKRSLKPFIIRQSGLATAVTLPILIVTYVALPWVVPHFLPEYVLGISPARILLIGLACIPLAGGAANFLNTINKQSLYLAVQATILIINVSLNVYLIHKGLGLIGVALGAAISYALYAIILNFMAVIVLQVNRK